MPFGADRILQEKQLNASHDRKSKDYHRIIEKIVSKSRKSLGHLSTAVRTLFISKQITSNEIE